MARAPEGCGDALVEHPADRQMNDALAETLLRQPVELLHGSHILSEPGLDELRVTAPEVVASKNRAGLDASGQQASAQRAISECRTFVFAAIGKKVSLDTAFEQIVRRLQHIQPRNSAKPLHLKHRK